MQQSSIIHVDFLASSFRIPYMLNQGRCRILSTSHGCPAWIGRRARLPLLPVWAASPSHASSGPLQAAPSSAFDRLLDWADEKDDHAVPGQRPVHVADAGGPAGRGLVATRDVEPGETLLSVPFTKVGGADREFLLIGSSC